MAKLKISMRECLNKNENLLYVKKLLDSNPDLTTRSLAKLLCNKYSFIAPNGEMQLSGCQVVLNDLHKQNKILLHTIKKAPVKFTSMILTNNEYPLPKDFPSAVGKIKGELEIILLSPKSADLRIIWNDLISREHPQGEKKLVGYQVKYLIKHDGYYIGAASFSSSSLNLEARDTWLRWSQDQKVLHQSKVINMSRFLIRKDVHCENLASHLLSKLVKRIKIDFKERYDISPWIIESFVDKKEYKGTCYQAANWKCIGETKGRGRNDRFHDNAENKKDIYIYVLEASFRETGGLKPELNKYEPIKLDEGLSSSNWATQEFGSVNLGDKRLTDRVVKVACHKGESPSASYPKAANGVIKDISGYYSFLENNNEQITQEEMLSGHRKNTICRAGSYNEILSIHDTTDLNYSGLVNTKGLGRIGKNDKSKSGTLGLSLHTTLACTLEGLPLGVLRAPCYAPEILVQKEKQNAAIPIEEKESFRWLQGYMSDIDVSKKQTNTMVISVMDREADIFELFKLADDNRKRNPVVIRSKHNRLLEGESKKLFEMMNNAEVDFKVDADIPSQRARKETLKKKARPYMPARTAKLSISFFEVKILPPKNLTPKCKTPISLCAIYAKEENPPVGSEKIEWRLLTTLKILTPEDACKCLQIYKKRWKIEEFFRILKSGCKIEAQKLDDARKIKRVIPITIVVAWRIMLLTLLGREQPNMPVDFFFDQDEIMVMNLISKENKKKEKIETIKEAIEIIASLGGYQNRKSDPPPGTQIMWEGMQELYAMVKGIKLYKACNNEIKNK